MRRFRRVFFVAILLGFAFIAAAYAFRARWIAPLVRDRIVAFCESSLGLSLVIDGIDGSYTTSLEIRGIATRKVTESGPIRSFAAGSVKLNYELERLLHGLDDFLAHLAIQVDGAEFEIDLTKPGVVDSSGEAAGPFSLPSLLPAVEVHGVRFSVKGPDYSAVVEELDISLSRDTSGDGFSHRLLLTSGSSRIDHASIPKEPFPWRFSSTYRLGEVTIDDLSLAGQTVVSAARVDLGGLLSGAATITADLELFDTALRIDGRLESEELKLRVSTESLPIGDLASLLRSPRLELSGDLTVDGWLTLAIDSYELRECSVRAAIDGATISGRMLGRIELVGKVEGEEIHLERLELDGPGNSVTIRDVTIARDAAQAGDGSDLLETSDGTFAIDLTNLPRVFMQMGQPRLAFMWPSFAKEHQLTARGTVVGGEVQLNEARLVLPFGEVRVRGGGRAFLPGAGRTLADCPISARVDLSFDALDPIGRLLGGPPIQGSLEGELFIEGVLADPSFECELSGQGLAIDGIPVSRLSVSAHGSSRVVAVRSLHLERGDDRIDASGSFDLGERKLLNGQIDLAVEDIAEYVPSGLDSTVCVRGRFDSIVGRIPKEGEALELAARGAFFEFGWGEFPRLAVEFDVSTGEKGVTVNRFEVKSGDLFSVLARGAIPVDPLSMSPLPGPLEGSVSLAGKRLGELLETLTGGAFWGEIGVADGELTAELDLSGTLASPGGHLSVKTEQVALSIPEEFGIPKDPVDIHAEVDLIGRELSIREFTIRGAGVEVDATGSLSDLPDWTEWRSDGPSLGRLDIDASASIPDLAFLRKFLAFRRFGGRLFTEFRVTGQVEEPSVEGVVSLQGVQIKVSPDLPGLEDIALDASFDSRSLSLNSLTGEVGASPFRASGEISWGREPRLDLVLNGEDLLLFRDDGLKLRADTDLVIRGPLKSLELSGRIALTDCRFVKNVEFLDLFEQRVVSFLSGAREISPTENLGFFSLRQSSMKNARFSIAITAKQPLIIKNNVANGGVRPELLLSGTGEIPELTGNVYFEPTTISLPASSLRIASGVVRFLETDPDRPHLDLVGQERIRGYDVTILVQGPMDAPEVVLSSSPPLPDEDLLLLVLTGQLPQGRPGDTSRQALISVASYLGKDLLSRFFADESTESAESILERFSVSMGRDVTETGEETIEASFRLVDDLIRDESTLSIAAERDRYDDYNLGLRIVFRFR